MSDRPDHLEGGLFQREGALPPPRRVPRTYSGGATPTDDEFTLSFDIAGNYTEDAAACVAKRVETNRSVRYFVKFGTTGADRDHMINPLSLYFRPDEVRREQSKTGRSRYEFRQVPEAAFSSYMRFLNTRTESYLRSAERQVLDA